MATQTAQLIVSLVDRLTGPAKAAADAVRNIGKAAESNSAALARMRSQMLEAAAAGYALKKSLQGTTGIAAEFETTLLDIGQKADMSDGAMKALGERIKKLAPTINQSAGEAAKAMDALMGLGLDEKKAEAALAPIGRMATAYGADLVDASKAAFAAMDNLKVSPEALSRALDAMATSGKEGAFEIKDMAAEFPKLTASASRLGIQGVDGVARLAAVLQVARKGAGTSADAATNVANLMGKITSPETTKKFEKFGINIREELESTIKQGGDPFIMIAELVKKATKGDLNKIGDLFEDSQVQQALTPLIQNLELYRSIRDKSRDTAGVVDKDFERRMKTSAAQTKAFWNGLNELGRVIGTILLPSLNELTGKLLAVTNQFAAFAEKNPELVGGAVKVAASLVALKIAAVGVAFAYRSIKGGALAAMAAIAATRLGALKAAAGMAALLSPTKLVTAALGAMRVALLSTGIGAAIVAAGTAAAFLARNWEGVKRAVVAFGKAFQAALGPETQKNLKPLMDAVAAIGRYFDGITSEIDPAKWDAWGTAAGKATGDLLNDMRGIASAVNAVVSGFRSTAEYFSGPGNMLANTTREFEAFQAKLGQVIDWIKAKLPEIDWWAWGEGIRSALGNVEGSANTIKGIADGIVAALKAVGEWWKTIGDLAGNTMREIDTLIRYLKPLSDLYDKITGNGSGKGSADAAATEQKKVEQSTKGVGEASKTTGSLLETFKGYLEALGRSFGEASIHLQGFQGNLSGATGGIIKASYNPGGGSFGGGYSGGARRGTGFSGGGTDPFGARASGGSNAFGGVDPTSGGGGTGASLGGDMGARARETYGALRREGFNHAQAAALLGHAEQESHIGKTTNPGEGAEGLIHWRGSRLANLRRFAAGRGESGIGSLGTQAAFLRHEMENDPYEKGQSARFRGSQSVAEASAALEPYIRFGDKASIGRRLANAQRYDSAFGGGGPAAGGIPAVGGIGGVDQRQQRGIRNQAITEALRAQIAAAALEAGVNAEIYSGGQDSHGPRRTGSHRHDHGRSADLKLYTMGKDGKRRYLSMNDDADRAVMERFIKGSVKAGATGVGAGPGYMGEHGIHIGGGSPSAWGAGGRAANAPDWVRRAHREGMAERGQGRDIGEGIRQASPWQPSSGAPRIIKPLGDAQGKGAGASSSSSTYNMGGIHVNAAPGQSADELAQVVERRLSARLNSRREGAYHDGVA